MSKDTDPPAPYQLKVPNGAESPADVARHFAGLVAFLAIPFKGHEPPALEGAELLGFHILLRTIGGCLGELERQIRDLIAPSAAGYQRDVADGRCDAHHGSSE